MSIIIWRLTSQDFIYAKGLFNRNCHFNMEEKQIDLIEEGPFIPIIIHMNITIFAKSAIKSFKSPALVGKFSLLWLLESVLWLMGDLEEFT